MTKRKPPAPITEAQVAAGVQALLKFTELKSTKRDPDGAVRAILEAARKTACA